MDEKGATYGNKLLGIVLSFLTVFLSLAQASILKKMELNFMDVHFMKGLLIVLVSLFAIWWKGNSIWIWNVQSDQNIHKIKGFITYPFNFWRNNEYYWIDCCFIYAFG